MDQLYFESGYLEAGYFESIKQTEAALTATFSFTATVDIANTENYFIPDYIEEGYFQTPVKEGAAALTVMVTHSTDIIRNRLAQVSITSAFTPTLSVTILKNHTAALNNQFDISITASKIAVNQSTLDNIVTLSLQGDRQRDLAPTTLSSSFTQSTQINKILTAQSTQNTAFTLTVNITKLLNAQSDLSSAFTVTTQVDKLLNAQSNLSTAVTLTTQVDKFLNAQSDQNSSFSITATVSKIIQIQADLSGVLASTLNIIILRNHTATLNSAFTVVVTADKIGNNTIAVSSAFGITVMGDRIRFFDATAQSTHSLNGVITRIRPLDSALNLESAVQVSVNRIQQFAVVLSAVFTPTLNIIIFRNHTATVSCAFGIECTVNVSRTIAATLSSDCTVICASERIRYININNIESNFAQSATVNKIAVVVSSQSSAFNLNASFVRIKQFNIVLDSVMTAVLTVSVNRSNSIVLNSQFAIATQISKITGYNSNISTDSSVQITYTRLRLLNQNIGAEFTVSTQATRIKSLQADLTGAFNSTLTITLSRDNSIALTVASTLSCESKRIRITAVTLSSATTMAVTAVETDSFSATFNSTVTINVTAQRFRSTPVTINATVKLGRRDSARTAKVITTVGGAKISTADYAFGSSSVVFDGSGDKLTVPSSTDFAFGTGDFSIEFFAKSGATFDVFNSTRNILDFRASNTNTIAPEIYLGAGNTIHYRVNGVDRISVTATTGALPYVLNLNFFNHVVVSRVNGSTRMYVDGVAAATVYTDSNDYVQGGLTIGGVVGASGNFAGYLDEIRIIKGTSPYTGNSLTVPTLNLTNTEETVLLIHGDGTNNSTNIQDDVQGFVENAKINRTASAQVNIQDAFNATMTVGIILGTSANLTSTTQITVLGTRVRLLNQGINAVSTLVAQVDRVISVTADLSSTVTTTSTTDRIRSVAAQFTDVFTAQMSITVSVNLLAALNTAFAFTVIPSQLLNSNAVIQSAFTISTAINGNFKVIASITSQSTLSVIGGLQRIAQSNIQARFSRVLNQGVTRTTTIIDTETPNQEYGAVGSALARFDGNSVLSISNMPQIGTGDYTIEMLAHRSAEMGDGSTFIEQDLFNADTVLRGFGVPQLGPHIYIGDDDEIKAGNTFISEGDQITTGEFKFQTDANLHIALVRHNGSTRLYVNGVQRGDTLADTVPWTTTEWFLGGDFFGYVDEFRVSNTARYTANFNNPYADLNQDQAFVKDANTIIYLSFDTVIDEPICSAVVRRSTSVSMQSQASRIVTEGGVTVSAVSKFGANSVQFDGVDDRITILNQPALGTGDFTIEMFFRRSQTQNDSTVMTLMQMYDDADSTVSDELSININTNEQVQYLVRGDVKLISNRIFDITDWHRVTVVRQNNVTKMWLDNLFTGDSFFDNNLINSNQVYVGNNQNLTLPYRGYVDDLQINKYSRYTTQHSTNSALPDQAYQLVGDGSSLMLHFNNAVIDLPLVEVSRVIRPATVTISSAFTPGITINTEINVAITLTSAVTFVCAVGVRKQGTAAHTAQSQLVVVSDRIIQIDSNFTVSSNITATGNLVKLFNCTAQSISSMNVNAVSIKIIQSNINTAFTLNTVVNHTVSAVASVTVSVTTQITVIRIQPAVSNITANCVVNATGTRIHPGVVAITVNSTVLAQAQKTVNSNITITAICTQTVLVGEIVQFSCAIQTEASTLTVAVRTGDFFVNMDSAFGLITDVRRTRSTSAEFNSAIQFAVTDFRFKQFEAGLSTILTQSTTVSRTRPFTISAESATQFGCVILRIKSLSTVITVSTTHTVTARRTGSGVAILVGTFTITAEPQPLDQILTVVRATMVGTLTAAVRKVFLEEYEYIIREEVRTLNIVEEQRDYLIVEEQRTLTIQGAE